MAMRFEKPPVALIAGPTASGKSALALRLAEQTGGVIVNADSAQIYRDLPILSAAPGPDERARAEHRLYGVLDGAQPCSAADWAAMARREIDDVHASGRLPILVGGTGLYLRTLLDGIAPVPAIDPDVRREVRETPVEENRAEACGAGPGGGRSVSSRRTPRASPGRWRSCCRPGGHSPNGSSSAKAGLPRQIDLRPLILLPPRDWLYRRCDERFCAHDRAGRRGRGPGAARSRARPCAARHARDRRPGDRRLAER